MNVKPITSFTGEYRFLSNFDTAPFTLRGRTMPSGEHAFVWGKLGYIEIRADEWDKRSAQWMRELTHAKYATVKGDHVGRLINTGAAMLVEGNTWGDKIWGRVNEGGIWKGLNLLGAILMEERGYWLHSDFKDKR
jgi:hypothetical protein